MRYRPLGRTGLVVSEVGFGAWGIGGRTANLTSYGDTDDQVSLKALHRAFDRGINFVDTSAAYGDGHSEVLIGQAIAGRRGSVVVASKAGYDSWERPPDFTPAAIRGSVERSLRRLRTDYLDLLQLHNPAHEDLSDGALKTALADMQRSGTIRAWGVSCKGPDEALAAIRHFGAPVVQANFNMMDVRALDCGLLEEAARTGTGFVARTPLCFGFLSGKIGRETTFPPGDHRARWPQSQLAAWVDGAAELLAAIPAAPGTAAAQAAIRFCLSFRAISVTIPGMLTPLEADQNAAASEQGELSAATIEAVLAINRSRRFFVSRAPAS